jgi:hypothetical protein
MPRAIGRLATTAGLIVLMGWNSTACSGPPKIGGSSSGASSSWAAPLNPLNWSLPSPPAVWNGVTRQTRSAWRGTQRALSPLNPFARSSGTPSANSRPAASNNEGGFWSGLFGPAEEPRRVETVNDFLRQPQPF